MKKNWLTTVGGIIGLLSGLPTVWGTCIAKGVITSQMPAWLYVACVFSLPFSIGIVGIASKGQDEHSTEEQVSNATVVKQVEQQTKQENL